MTEWPFAFSVRMIVSSELKVRESFDLHTITTRTPPGLPFERRKLALWRL